MKMATDIFETYEFSPFFCIAKNILFQERKTEWLTLIILHIHIFKYVSECVVQIYRHIP